MTARADIIRMAREAELIHKADDKQFLDQLERFSGLVVEHHLQSNGQYVTNDASREAAIAEAVMAERQACAKLCDDAANPGPEFDAAGHRVKDKAVALAYAIRARWQTDLKSVSDGLETRAT